MPKISNKKKFFSGNIICPFNAKFLDLKKRHGLFLCNHINSSDFLSERALFVFSLKGQLAGIRIIARAFSLGYYTNELKNEQYTNMVKAGRELGFTTSAEIQMFLPTDTYLSLSIGERVTKSALIGYLRS